MRESMHARRRQRIVTCCARDIDHVDSKALVEVLDKFPEARQELIRIWDAEENDGKRKDGTE